MDSTHRSRLKAFAGLAVVAVALAAAQNHGSIAPDWQAALNHISADSLRGNLSFLSSDLLEGRNTPSRGLDIAAEYIASRFRAAGLEPAGDDGYFQTANMLEIEQDISKLELTLVTGEGPAPIPPEQVFPSGLTAVELADAPVVKVDASTTGTLEGKVAIAGVAVGPGVRKSVEAWRALKPALLVVVDGREGSNPQLVRKQLIDPAARATATPWITLRDPKLHKAVHALKPGPTEWKLSIKAPAPAERTVSLRNVIAVLRGSDPQLKETYVMLTAHYDHIGSLPDGDGDRIYNGANDDGSGTVSVIEIAAALRQLKQHPKRSVVFLTVFGEEKGGYGSQWYVRHPVFPLGKTIADVNLEQLGRTDSSKGPQVGTAAFTGNDYSDLPKTFIKAGELTGVKVYKDPENNQYFNRSDNAVFANAGIPAHTVCVAFVYPDYHGLGDEWQKIDYGNMAKVNRMLALGVLMLADSADAPKWISSAQTQRYIQAQSH